MTTTASPLGSKYTCTSCSTRFYDMNKLPATCPKCAQRVPTYVKAPPRRGRRSAAVEAAADSTNVTATVNATPAPKRAAKSPRWR